ncbi:TetR/AcrR family transcriptional regulator [Petrimonas sp.]|uniref:TetR/AcrR family transcriptional regulator n=1 Tax=Petrimonas sp. TaxID=2023866 RepID=UPI003F51597D
MEIKERIAFQAGELFMVHGVKNISMDEVASTLGMSKRTIYQHFKDKEELLIYFLQEKENQKSAGMEQLWKSMPTVIDVFLHIIERHRNVDSFYGVKFKEDIDKYYPKARAKMKELREKGFALSKKFLSEGIEQGVIRSNLNLDVAAFLLQGTNDTYIHAMRMAPRPFSIWELFFTMMVNFIRGISSEKGLKIVDAYLENQTNEKNFTI